MRKCDLFWALSFLLMSLSFVACTDKEKDEPKNPSEPNEEAVSIVGTWEITHWLDDYGWEPVDPYDNDFSYLKFSKDGVVKFIDDGVFEGKYEKIGDRIFVEYWCDECYEYEHDTWYIESLSSTTLILGVGSGGDIAKFRRVN